MTDRHRWLQGRLVAMARRMGCEPIAEHPPTRADVYVPGAGLAIEVQLRPTQFGQRTAARRAAGATTVLWMLSPDALPAGQQHRLFEQPAVRWRAVHRVTKEPVKPWGDPSTNADARVQVFGTVAVPAPGSGGSRLTTSAMDGYQFLHEVLHGVRVWVPPNTFGMPRSPQGLVAGGWVRPEQLQEAAAAIALSEARPSVPSPCDVAVTVAPTAEVAGAAEHATFTVGYGSGAPESSATQVDTSPAGWLRGSPATSEIAADDILAAERTDPMSMYRVVSVATLPHPHPLKTSCMRQGHAPGPSGTWRWWSRLGQKPAQARLRDCCWYHRGDWALACGFAVSEVQKALAEGVRWSEMSQFVTAAVKTSITDPWQAEAITSLLDPVSAMILDEGRAVIVDGHHRAFVMRQQGVNEALVLWSTRPDRSEPTAGSPAGSALRAMNSEEMGA